MMHVAEAGEDKGRVVLQLCSGHPNPVAVDAAVWLARAFGSEIESLYVEDQQLVELARYPFAREISLSGRHKRSLSSNDIERHFRFASAEFRTVIESRARAAEVPCRSRVMRGEPVAALAVACSECGPWNVVALAEPFTSPACPPLKQLFETVSDTTGLMIVGPEARRARGPIVIAIERLEQLATTLGAAERLAAVDGHPISVCLIAEHDSGLAELEPAVRLALSERPNVAIAGLVLMRGSPAAAAEALRRMQPGLIIGRFGGLLVPEEGDLRPLAAGLECPLLLVRSTFS